VRTQHDWHGLNYPAECRHFKEDGPILKLLLDREEVDVSPRLDPGVLGVFCEAQPPVCLAAYIGSKQVLKILLRGGTNVNAINSLGSSPLHLAVRRVDANMVRL
jgi:ankyrin repeat protein